MGGLNGRVGRIEEGALARERQRAVREVKRIIGELSDEELLRLFDYPPEDFSAAPPPEAFGLSWDLLWRALGRPRAMSPKDGRMALDCTDAEAGEVGRRLDDLIRPMLGRVNKLEERRRA